MKELNHVFFRKGLFASVKEHLFVTKKAPRQFRWRSNPLNLKLFLKNVNFKLRKVFFFKKGTFNEASNPYVLYLSKLHPGSTLNTSVTEVLKNVIDLQEHKCANLKKKKKAERQHQL